MKRKSTLVDSVSAEPEVSAVGRKRQFPQSNGANSAVGKKLSIVNCALSIVNCKLSIVNCTLLIVFCLFFGGKAWGQTTLTVYGDNTTTNEYVPIYGWYCDEKSKVEFIIPADKLSDMNGGSVSAMKFYLASSNSSNNISATFNVFVKEVNATTLTGFTGTTNATIVYSSTISIATNQSNIELNIPFSSNYVYGGGNLLVGVYQTGNTSYNHTYWTGEDQSENTAWQAYGSGSGSGRTFLPKTTFTYTIPTTPFVTLSPSSATVLTGFTQTLTATRYNVSGTPSISYSSSNTSVATVTGSGTSATVTGVAAGSATITATMTYQGNNYTATCAITVEDPSYCEPSFSDPSDDYISNFATSGGTTNINNTSNYVSSGYSDYYNNNSVSIEAGATLTCTVTSSSTQWSYGHAIWVDWNKDYEFTSDERVAYTSSTATGNWTGSFVVPANIAAGDYRMRVIHFFNNTPTDPCMSDYYGEAEDYKLTVTSSCLAPTNVTVTNVTEHSVSLEWTPRGSASQWIIVWDREEYASTHPVWRNYITTTATSYTITDYAEVVDIEHTGSLTPGTEYRFRVFSDCEDPRPNAPDVNATTEYACPKPTNVTVSNLAPSRATVSWESNAGNYTVRYSTATITGTTLDPVFEDGFESGLTGWTTYALGYDNATYNWQQYDGTAVDEGNHMGYYVAASRSWHGSNGDQSVDNWLVTPQMTLGDVVKFWVACNDGFRDSYAVYISTGSNVVTSSSSIGDFVLVKSYAEATGTWTEISVDINAYAGQQGYVAIRHTNYGGDHIFVDDFGVYNTVNAYSYGGWTTVSPNPTTESCQITGLSAETLYAVQVQANCGGTDGSSAWSSVMFTTPDNCGAPQELASSNITSTTATLAWSDDKDIYNLQYRRVYFYEDFEGSDGIPTGWTTINNSATAGSLNWQVMHMRNHSGNNSLGSGSYIYQNNGITPDNWLISPQLDLQGTLRVWLSGYPIGSSQYSEHFAIYISTSGSSVSNFITTLVGETTTTDSYVEYTADLSSYAGQSGYIAIRHFNCSDQNYLCVDDFGLYGSENWVNLSPNPTTETANLTGLTPASDYEWQVRGVYADCAGGYSRWSNVANFTTLKQYTVSLSANPTAGGTVSGAGTYDESTNVSILASANAGYSFTNWTEGGSQVSTNASYTISSINANHTMVANFTPIEYTITYNLAGGSVATDNPTSYTVETATFTLNNPTKEGYTFAGWTGTGLGSATTTVTIAQGSTGDRSYTATWTPINYTITYNLAGGSATNPTSYTIETATFTLNNPTRTGYTFAGWTGTGLSEATQSVTIAQGSTGDRSYTATWTPINYTVTAVIYPTEGGSATGAGIYAYNTSCTLEASANSGYQFVNWTASNGSVVSANASYTFTVTGDVTYQANFTKTTVTSLPWTENFEGYSCGTWEYLHGEWATPLRWTKAACVTNYSWGAYSNSYCMELRANNSTNLVVLPQFDGPLNKLKIKFQIGRGNTASGYTVKLGYVTDPSDASTFHELSTINTPSNPVASHTQYTCDLTTNNNAPSSSEYRLAIKYTTTNMEDSWYLDDFDVRRVYTIAVSDDPSSSSSSLSGDGKYDHGANCTVTATAGDCYNFVNWTENGSVVSTDASYSFTAEADRNLVANFTQWTLNIDNNQTSLECINTGTEVVLTASATSNSTPTYEWAVSSGSTEGTASSNTYTVSPTALSNTYTVSATVGSCERTQSATITTKPVITSVSSSAGNEFCLGVSTDLSVESNASSFTWDNDAGSGSPVTVTPTATTTYKVSATSGSCVSTSSITITVNTPDITDYDYIWRGVSDDWNTAENWYMYSEGNYSVALALPSETKNYYIGTGDCLPSSQWPSLSADATIGNVTIDGGSVTVPDGVTLSIAGTISGALTAEEGSTIEFVGSSDQTINDSQTFSNVTFSKDGANEITATGGLTVNGTATFTSGIVTGDVTFGSGATVSGASTSSYVNGKVTRNGMSGEFTFPTGTATLYAPFKATSSSASNVSVQYAAGHDGMPDWWNHSGNLYDAGLNHASDRENWQLSASASTELSSIILYWNESDNHSFEEGNEALNSYLNVAAVKRNGFNWQNLGRASIEGDYDGSGSITAAEPLVIEISGAKAAGEGDYFVTFASSNNNLVLPIELTSFTATCDGRSALVEWSTATEKNNGYFSLERSDDAINFVEVARVAGAGNSIEPIDYAYNDYGIHGGDNYYRLVQVDYDGTRTVSEVIVANCIEPESDGEPEVLAYPNPFSSELTVVLDNFGNRAATIEVYDMLGKLIYTNKVASPQNSYETILNLSNLPPAAYTVRVSTNDFVINRNVVKN